MKQNSVADSVAASMLAIMESDEHKRVFSGPTLSFTKSAAGCCVKCGGSPCKCAESNDAKDKAKDKGKDKKKDEKEEKDETDGKKGKMPPWLEKGKDNKSKCAASIQGLAKISEVLDEMGFEKAASDTLSALETLVKEAFLAGEEGDPFAPGGILYQPSEEKESILSGAEGDPMAGLDGESLADDGDVSLAKDKDDKKEDDEEEDEEEEKEEDEEEKEDESDANDVSLAKDKEKEEEEEEEEEEKEDEEDEEDEEDDNDADLPELAEGLAEQGFKGFPSDENEDVRDIMDVVSEPENDDLGLEDLGLEELDLGGLEDEESAADDEDVKTLLKMLSDEVGV